MGDRHRILTADIGNWLGRITALREEHGKVLPLESFDALVVARHVDGCDHVLNRYAQSGDRYRPSKWGGWKPDLVGFFAHRHATVFVYVRLWRRSGMMTDTQDAR
ncbi:hypothetical protein [Adhaeretor mobilis]|uniref:hypothetical protein n=1 Tax=Adhaeretor mobilis TaxID=1930276 RepID=UPI0011A3BAC2|nr:hypothetical protein [Adhaeretor mobilis]